MKPQRTDTVQISRTPNPYAIMGKPVELKPDPNQPTTDMNIKINPPCSPEFYPNRSLDYTTTMRFLINGIWNSGVIFVLK